MFDRIDENFEPSSQTKESMLYVRKKPLLLGAIQHPGLFGIHGYTVDWVFFIMVIILEGIGLYAFYNSLEQSDTSIFTALMATGAMLLVDFILAFYHHRFNTGTTSRLKIENILLSKNETTEANISIQNNRDMITKKKNTAFVFSVLLVLLASAKFVIFFQLGEGDEEREYGVVVFMAVAYLLAAVIHIKVTGYLLHAVWANWLFSRDVNAFKKSGGSICRAQEYTVTLDASSGINEEFSIRTHKIMKSKSLNGDNEMILEAKGLLMDNDVHELSNRIRDGRAKSELVLKAMELQLRMA